VQLKHLLLQLCVLLELLHRLLLQLLLVQLLTLQLQLLLLQLREVLILLQRFAGIPVLIIQALHELSLQTLGQQPPLLAKSPELRCAQRGVAWKACCRLALNLDGANHAARRRHASRRLCLRWRPA